MELDSILKGMGINDYSIVLPELIESDKDPEIIFVPYNSILEEADESLTNYIPFQVKVEISCRSLREPCTQLMMRSLIAEENSDEGFSENYFGVNTVLPYSYISGKGFLVT